jgi:hypothetical protein
MKRALFVAAVMMAMPLGCGSDDPAPDTNTAACAADHVVGAACAGVPSGKLCEGGGCAPASCTSTVFANNDADLQAAVGSATDGTCIVLGAGNFSAITLPPVRVGVYAEAPSVTTVSSVTITGGDDVELSGFSTASVTLSAGTGRLDALRIENSPNDGVSVGAGASVTIERSEIRSAARYGVSGFDSDSVTLSGSVIEDNSGPGLWLQTGNGGSACGTAADPSLITGSVSNSVFRKNTLVGIAIARAQLVTIDNVIVADTTVGKDFAGGGGVSVAYCSTVNATDLQILDSADFGMLVHDSSLSLNGGAIDGNLRYGLWIQNVGTSMLGSVTVNNASLDRNAGVGIGIAENSTNVSINTTSISNTKLVSLPVLVNGVSASADEVGDGINWQGLSQAVLGSVTVSGSARASVLIDGEVASGSSVTNLALEGGDESKGIVQQNLPSSGTQPVTSGTTPSVTTSVSETFSVPSPIEVPPGI